MTTLKLLSMNVGQPKVIGIFNGESVLSGIDKQPVASGSVVVGPNGIEGDGQADLENHGGPEKAVYAYAVENWPWWEVQHDLVCLPATLGENLTLSGADEIQVRIGDRFSWGEALLEISQPRAPCFKLAIHTGHSEVPQAMTLSGRCGWYLRVVQPGRAPVLADLVRTFESDSPTVRETFATVFAVRPDMALLRRIHGAPALSPAWRQRTAKKLGAIGG
jgi:MOSC domain-containing protein YiiM